LKVINNRYRIVDTILKESNTIEYLVVDLKENKMIKRLKIFDTEMSNIDFVKNFEMHFLEVSRLYHENLLSSYEFETISEINGNSVNRNQFFYTYEHYDQSKLISYTDLNKSEINQVLVQLCKAVRYLHFRGFSYKYLSFDALLFMRIDGKIILKIREFANNYVDDYFFKMGHDRNNHFIAPEVLWGEVPDNTADIYSLGNILYYLYYKVDYHVKSIQNISKSPQLSELHKFILRATSHIKDERHQNMAEFITALSKRILIDIDHNDYLYYDRLYDLTRIIGRDNVLKDISKLIEDKQKKNTLINAMMIHGENGCGKSRVIQEMAFTLKINKVNHLMIHKSHYEEHEPFPIVKRIVEHLTHQEDLSPMLIQKYGQELVSIVPSLREKWNLKEESSEMAKLRLLNRAFNFFIEYTANQFFVLLIDDEEALSGNERYFFDLLIQQKNQANFCMIMTGHTTDKDFTKYDEMVKTIKLTSLNLEETGLLVQATLGMNHIPYKLTHRLMLETQGMPSATKRMIKKLWQDGVIYFNTELLKWELDRVDDGFKFEYEIDQSSEIEKIIHNISSHQQEILKKLAILKESFNMSILLEFTEISEEEAYFFIYNMEEAKVITKRISDVEYVFGINGNDLKKAFYDMLTLDDIKALSKRVAFIYERRYHDAGEINEALIEYLVDSDNLIKAAEYCMLFSEQYFVKSNAHKALDLLELALSIYEKLGDCISASNTTKKLIKHYIKIGKLERAERSITFLKENNMIEHVKDKIDISLDLATIAYYKNDVQIAIDIADEALDMAIDSHYIEGEFEAAKIKCRCLRNSGDLAEHLTVSNYYLEKSYASDLIKYQAVFENEKGVNYLYSNEFEACIASFNRSLERYKILEDEENIITLLNNFGVIYLDGYGDYYLARDYFRKAYNRASNRNFFVSIPTYLNNIGETYRIEFRYVTAIKYFEESYQMADNVGDKNIIVLALLNVCQAYLLNENYAKTHTIINRLEHEIDVIKRRDHDQFDYFMLHFEYYLTMNSVIKADKWRYNFNADDILDDYRKYRLKIIDLKLEYKKNRIIFNQKKIPFDALTLLKSQTRNPSEAKLLRDFTLELMFDIVDDHDFVTLDRIMVLDDALKEHYNTKHVRMKRDVIDACISDDAIERIHSYIPFFKENSQEMLWRTYKILGDEYYFMHQYYEALRYYLLALDVLAELSEDIIHEFKETYILYDDVKMALKTRINKIVEIFQSEEDTHLMYEDRIDNVKDFFDLSLYQLLYTNKAFKKLISENYTYEKVNKYKNPTDLIQSLGKDERENLKMILQFFEQISYSERAMLYIYDEHDNISEVIAASDDAKPFDLMRLLNNIGSDTTGVFVNKIDSATNKQLLSKGQMGFICFPIHESDVTVSTAEKRREDLLIMKRKIVGYVFIDTTNVINHINESTFDLCKSFISLTYLMINNYHLKRISTIDKLTGVNLRKHIEQEFTKELSIARLKNIPLSVIMLDIDKFKSVNDNYGHRKGDEILSHIGELIKQSIRNSDYVGRYGGEEFIIILPETDAHDGYRVAEKIRMIIDERKLLGEEMPLTVSLGISTFPIDGANEEELIEKADQSLYYSKNNGRNKATSWDEKLIKEGHRYDRLTGILTGNISSDTRNVQAMLDIIKQLSEIEGQDARILNTFMTLIDITEGDEISFIKFSNEGEVCQTLYKKKGQAHFSKKRVIDDRLIQRFKNQSNTACFIDWDEIVAYDESTNIPNWKSYIILSFNDEDAKGMLAISVEIKDKEFDFSNMNFVESLKPILKHILF